MIRFAIFWLFAGFLALFGSKTLLAQNTQMDRDLEVGKNLLELSLRKNTRTPAASGIGNVNFYVPDFYIFSNTQQRIEARYVSETGVVFSVTDRANASFGSYVSLSGPVAQPAVANTRSSFSVPLEYLTAIDGKIVSLEEMGGLRNIAEMNVIKGEAAIRKYGQQAEGMAGVMEITTREARVEEREIEEVKMLEAEKNRQERASEEVSRRELEARQRTERAIEEARRSAGEVREQQAIQAQQEVELALGILELDEKPTLLGRANSGDPSDAEQTIRAFLLDYGHLFGAIKENELIIVEHYFTVPGQRQASRREYSIKKSDVDQFRKGVITREQANAQIMMEIDLYEDLAADIKTFAELIYRQYPNNRVTENYFASNIPHLSYSSRTGLSMNWSVFSSIGDAARNQQYNLPSFGKSGINQQQRDALVKGAYPKFVQSIKENIVDYGRIITSMKPGERMELNVKLSKCDDCGIPASVSFEWEYDVIDDLIKGKIDRNQAMNRIKVVGRK
jgi:hypothetical protein